MKRLNIYHCSCHQAVSFIASIFKRSRQWRAVDFHWEPMAGRRVSRVCPDEPDISDDWAVAITIQLLPTATSLINPSLLSRFSVPSSNIERWMETGKRNDHIQLRHIRSAKDARFLFGSMQTFYCSYSTRLLRKHVITKKTVNFLQNSPANSRFHLRNNTINQRDF